MYIVIANERTTNRKQNCSFEIFGTEMRCVIVVALLLALLCALTVAATPSSRRARAAARARVPATSKDAIAGPGQTPQDACGWPYMSEHAGRFGPATVRLAQHLLAGVMRDKAFQVNGVFGPQTAALVRRFQTSQRLSPVDGVLGPVTWARLAAVAAPIRFERSQGQQVLGLQDALDVQGFACNETGRFDLQTVAALRAFQRARGDTTTDGRTATAQTWHLLATGCNTTGSFWFDAGWPQGRMSSTSLECLRKQGGMKFATFECWVEEGANGSFWPECVGRPDSRPSVSTCSPPGGSARRNR